MSIKFDIIDYLSGLTAYVFDVSVLRRVALDNGVAEVREYNELDAEQIDRCKMSLLETLVLAPSQSASQTNKHGEYQTQTGSQMLTDKTREAIKAELRMLYGRYGEDERLQQLDSADTTMEWITEY